METQRPATFESVALDVLAYEFRPSEQEESTAKIKRRLSRRKLGPYNSERVEMLRRLKNELQHEIGLYDKSRFFAGSHGEFADMRDFDVPLLTEEMIQQFPQIPAEEIKSFVPFCVYLYHLR